MHPVLLSTPWFNVYSYGLLVALSYTAGTAWVLFLARRERLPVEAVFDMLLLQLVAGILGSRLLYFAEIGLFSPGGASFWDFEKGGLTFYGAVLSGIFFDLLFLRFKQNPFWRVMDCVGNGILLGIGLGRLGCFLNGCCYGVACHLPWGMVFPRVSAEPLHPTQLYESFGSLLLFVFHQKYWQRRTHHGHGCILSVSLYAAFRFIIEFWRGDNPIHALGMTLSQWVSLGLLAAGFLAWHVIKASPDMQIISRVPPKLPVEGEN